MPIEHILEQHYYTLLIGAMIAFISMMAAHISKKLGAPLLLTFLGVGILFGEDGLGGIHFNNKNLAFQICSITLAMILFDGGLRTTVAHIRTAFKPALSLATLGVIITAGITGLSAVWWFEIPLWHGLLLGSLVASTDAAAVFLLLHQKDIKLSEKLNSTLEMESGLNDPMAIFLTIAFISLVSIADGANANYLAIVQIFLKQTIYGGIIGYGCGKGLSIIFKRARFDTGLYPVITLITGIIAFSAANSIGGSGFLATYLAGIIFANSGFHKMFLIRQFNDGMAWIAQIVMLLTLGLLVTPSHLIEHWRIALTITLILIFISRPIAVWISLSCSSFSAHEKLFVSWVGLRGAIPIYLALLPSLASIPESDLFFNIAFMIVLASLTIQGFTIHPLAKYLGLLEKDKHPAS